MLSRGRDCVELRVIIFAISPHVRFAIWLGARGCGEETLWSPISQEGDMMVVHEAVRAPPGTARELEEGRG